MKTRTAEAVQEIYRPVLRGYFAVFAFYYLIMLPTHFAHFEGWQLNVMAGAAVLAAFAGIFGAWFMRKPQPISQIEFVLIVLNLLVVVNIVIALNLEFATEKLVYFVIIGVGFSLANASFRQAIFSLSVAAVAFAIFISTLEDQSFVTYAYISLGAALGALAITFLIRRAITSVATAKIKVENDLLEAREMSEKLERRSLSDSLTGLPNRRAFFNALRGVLSDLENERSSQNSWLLLIDLDGFKSVNDVHGHITGDLLLKEVARRLRSFAVQGISVHRMGGDEFNIIITNNEPQDAVLQRCDRLLSQLSAPYLIDDRVIRISASIGARPLDRNTTRREQINQADFALMHAKKQGRNQVVLFNEELAVQAEERGTIEAALRNADFKEELSLVFQPQFDLETNEIVQAEVLARWTSAEVGPIEADRFIRIAEESGLITDITLTIVTKTFAEISKWPIALPVSINLSCHDLISKATIEKIMECADHFRIEPSMVEFEVTETAMMADKEKAIAHLEWLASRGFSIALDDFGTGYSNFSYLRSLPISKLKIDRSFLENPGDPMTEKILSSLAGMARILGVHCLFEGIEDEIGLLMAKRAGADTVQGYLFGKPVDASELMLTIADGSLAKLAAEPITPQPTLVYDNT